MSELREECYKCLNNQSCPGLADYGSIICMTKRKFKMPSNEDDSVYAIKFAVMQQQIDEKDKEIEKLKKFINLLQLKNVKDLSTKIYMANFINDNTPYTKDTKELENEEGTRTVDFTVKYFERKAEKE